MSLTLALRTALSGLNHVQSAIQLTSNNVSNVNTEGYTRKNIESATRVIAGVGAGVLTSDIMRHVDEFLAKDVRSQLSQLGIFSVREQFLTQTQDFFGAPGDSSSLTASLGELVERIEALSAFPEDLTRVQQVIDSARHLTTQINDMARKIQELRARADSGIADSVNTINTELQKIDQLNREISRNLATGKPTADLEDQRDRALNTIAEHVGISYFYRDTGEVIITTQTGTTLLDSRPATVTHTPAGGVDAGLVYPGGFDAIAVDGRDITTSLKGGKLSELVQMRDSFLPDLQAQLDALSNTLTTEINALHNQGTGIPARNALTGTLSGLAGADPFAGTGTVRITVVDGAGKAVAVPLDLDLGAYATVGDLVTAIDAGLGGLGSASLDAEGRLVISAANAANGIAISEGSSDVTATGRGFSHHFGLNDFFVGDATNSLASNIAVRSDLLANPALMSRGEVAGPPAVIVAGSTVLSQGDNSVIARIAARMSENVSFPAAGGLAAFTGTFTDYSAQILGSNSVAAAEAEDGLTFRQTVFEDLKFRMSSQSGVNVDEEMALLVELQNAFAANARVFTVTSEMIRILGDIGR